MRSDQGRSRCRHEAGDATRDRRDYAVPGKLRSRFVPGRGGFGRPVFTRRPSEGSTDGGLSERRERGWNPAMASLFLRKVKEAV